MIYVEGYFLSHSPEAAMELARWRDQVIRDLLLLSRFAQKHRITFVFNLCGEYVCEDITYVENVLAILPFIDILFGNLSEFEVFIDTIEAKLETSSSVIRNLRAMIRSEGVENLDMKIENICESPVGTNCFKGLKLFYANNFFHKHYVLTTPWDIYCCRCVPNQRAW